jgi:hypothetical protein
VSTIILHVVHRSLTRRLRQFFGRSQMYVWKAVLLWTLLVTTLTWIGSLLRSSGHCGSIAGSLTLLVETSFVTVVPSNSGPVLRYTCQVCCNLIQVPSHTISVMLNVAADVIHLLQKCISLSTLGHTTEDC